EVVSWSQLLSRESNRARFECAGWIPYCGVGLHQPFGPISEQRVMQPKSMSGPPDDVAAVRSHIHAPRDQPLRPPEAGPLPEEVVKLSRFRFVYARRRQPCLAVPMPINIEHRET